jgi:hypothetical protein
MADLIDVTVTRDTTGKLTATLDGTALNFVANVAKRKVPPGEHKLGWVVEGKGSSYTIKVTTPPSAVFERSVQKTGQEIVLGTKKLEVL